MTIEPVPEVAYISQGYTVRQSQEPGVVISERHYRRYIERLDGCRARGWSDLWLAGTGIGGGLAAAALVTVLVLPSTVPSADKAVLWMLMVVGIVMSGLCLGAYLTQRHERDKEINELKRDLELHQGDTKTAI